MANRKPLVLNAGVVAQIPTGDLLTCNGVMETGVIAPSAFAGPTTINDYAPANFATARLILQGATGSGVSYSSLTGLAGGAAGRIVTIVNTSTDASIITFANENAGSVAANRFTLPATTVYLTAGGAATFYYDGNTGRWRLVDFTSTTQNITQIASSLNISGVLTTSGAAFSGASAFASSITPAAITGTVNDYSPTNIGTVFTLHQDLTGAATLTGLTAAAVGIGNSGRILIIDNISTTFSITLKHENAGSTAANRFSLPNSADYTIAPNSGVMLRYYAAASRWRLIIGA